MYLSCIAWLCDHMLPKTIPFKSRRAQEDVELTLISTSLHHPSVNSKPSSLSQPPLTLSRGDIFEDDIRSNKTEILLRAIGRESTVVQW